MVQPQQQSVKGYLVSIAIIDCGAGNLHSVHKALVHVCEGKNIPVAIARNAKELKGASHVVLPGVGAFHHCMQGLRALDGVIDYLNEYVYHGTTPFLGICVGMQMLFEASEEFGEHEGLGWFKGRVKKLSPSNPQLRIPHMGWNALTLHISNHPLLNDIRQGDHAYFVHSYHACGACDDDILASVDYGGRVVAMIGKGHIAATQFHPEKSQHLGLSILRNFTQSHHA